jgi:hypothetical protein
MRLRGRRSLTTIAGLATQLSSKLALSGGTLTGNLSLAGAPSSDLHAATKAYVDSEIAAAASDYLDPADYGASTNGTNAAATQTAWEACIADALTLKKPIRFSGTHLFTDVLEINGQVKIIGFGAQNSILKTASQGVTALTIDPQLESSGGAGPILADFLLTGDWSAYSATVSANSIGLHITNTFAGSGANVAFTFLSNVTIEGFTDNLVLGNHYYTFLHDVYSGGFRRYGIRSYNNWTTDSGDIFLWGPIIHGVASSVGGFDAAGSSLRIEQGATNVFGGKIYGISGSGHARGVHIYGNCSDSGETVPSGMIQIRDIQFDSFASNTCIVIDSDWGRGGANTANPGTKIMNVVIAGNNGSNCGRMLDLAALDGALWDIHALGNTAIGGGGIRVANLNGGFINGNVFNNAAIGGSSAGGGYGPAIPYEETGTVTGIKVGVNYWRYFTSDPDVADTSGAYDITEAQVELTPATSTVTIPVNSGGFGSTFSEIDGAQTITWDISGADAIVDGACGVHSLHYSGTSGAPAFSAPSGFTVVTAKKEDHTTSFGFPTAADDLLVDIYWRVKGTRIRIERIVSYSTIAGLTTEGGGSVIMEDDFTGTNGTSTDGRTPDTTAGPSTWTNSGFFIVTSGYAVAELEINHGTYYDTGSADGVYTVVTNSPSGSEWATIHWNYADANNYWAISWRMSDGFLRLVRMVAGAATYTDTTVSIAVDTDVEWVITIDGDDLTIAKDGSTITALTTNEPGRALKTNDSIGIVNGTSGFTKFKHVTFASL